MTTPRVRDLRALALLCLWLAIPPARGDDAVYSPNVAPASDEGRRAIAGFRVPDGLTIDLFAAEPMLANPVVFAIDHKNRFYVAETFRLHAGVSDIRGHMDWLEHDLSSKTVEDRVQMYRERLSPEEFVRWGTEHDRIRLIEDTTGDGQADRATVFADGFKGQETGIGAGLVVRGDTVWYTNIPHLWKLRDTNGDGRADERTALSSGYGVHVGFLGHDLHGAILGPDGRLYFSIGDRGLNVLGPDGETAVFLPDTGAILRCDPETGWPLEVVATGFRNPQELAFNEFGDLFTVDNNSDSGDQCRLVHIVEGGDSGWRIGYQFMQSPVSRGPFNAEKLWYPEPENTAPSMLPPLANFSDGPSGLVYNPGVSLLPDSYQGHFFLADFRGSPGQSGIRAFTVAPKGSTYELTSNEQFLWGLQATDVDFGTDGALYVSDWVEGWGLTGKGRIYKLADPGKLGDPAVSEVEALLAEGMAERAVNDLSGLLGHADMRVRLEAQFELSRRAIAEMTGVATGKPEAFLALQNTALDTEASALARRHALWGMAQLSQGNHGPSTPVLVTALKSPDPDIRAQAARGLGDGAWTRTARHMVVKSTSDLLCELLSDPSPQVRFHAALALRHATDSTPVGPILTMLRKNADADAYLRHAGVMALVGMADEGTLLNAIGEESASVRLGVLLALRRLKSPEVARFLSDEAPELVLEAARAINDVPIEPAMPRLAALEARPEMSDALLYRVVNANLHVGGTENARNLARIAAMTSAPEPVRVMALEALTEWGDPDNLDRIVGLYRPIPERSTAPALAALGPILGDLLADPSEPISGLASRAASALGIREAVPALLALLENPEAGTDSRVEALKGLDRLEAEGLLDATRASLDDPAGPVRSEALHILARLSPEEAIPGLKRVLEETGDVRSRQEGLATLGAMDFEAADALLGHWLDALLAGQVAPEIQLDVIEAARERSNPAIQQRLARYEASLASDDPLAPYRVTLAGGDFDRGLRIFREKAEVSCLRCHKIDGKGGEVGPDLTGLGEKQTREYLLESIVLPDKVIAEGFETVVVALTDGQVVSGVSKGTDGETLRLMTAEAELLLIPEADIEERARGVSAMPEDVVKYLTPREMRDLIEFLAGSAQRQRDAL